jgi:hypothetical protein
MAAVGYCADSAATADWAARAKEEIPRECKKLEDALGQWQGTITGTREKPVNAARGTTKPVKMELKGEYFLNSRVGGGLMITANILSESRKVVSGFTADYDYALSNPADKVELFIRQYQPHPSGGEKSPLLRAWDKNELRPLLGAEDFSGVRLPQVLDATAVGAKLVSITPQQVNGRTLVRVACERTFEGKEGTYLGWALLDPENHWAITSYEQQYSWGTIKNQLTYRTDVAEVAFPQHIVRTDVQKGGQLLETHTFDLARPEPCTAPAQRFALEAFGLEPPRGAPSPQPPRKKWLVTFNIILFLVLGLFFSILAWRRRSRQAQAVQGAAFAAGAKAVPHSGQRASDARQS